ncbi:MAG: permease [Psychromonas sp.]
MLTITLILYAITFFSDPSVALSAVNKSLVSLKMVAPILLVVFLLMALLNSFIKPKKIAKYLGQESGLKGEIIALTAGVVSHGPTYVWYPILQELRNHGARDGLIVAFLYARAIKLPWLPMMIGYFGIAFTLILTVYILLAALLQAVIVDKLAVK